MRNFTTEEGAAQLASRIQAYWAEQGADVVAWAEKTEFDPRLRACRYDVRTNLVNGMPRRGLAPRGGVQDS